MSSALANRLKKNVKRLRAWAKGAGVTCYRVYDRDLPDVPLALDLYEAWLHASVFEPRHGIEQAKVDAWMRDACAALEISAERTVVKRRAPGADYEKRADRAERFAVREGGLSFWVNLVDYLDTGLFLDHRATRARVRSMSAGKRVLNLFAYTGSFSVYAAAGGAASTVSVDLSPAYCAWAQDNFALNALAGQNDVVTADAVRWLEQSRATFDLAVIDPPTVSFSKRADAFDIQRDHRRLIEGARARLAPGGVIMFSTNFQGIAPDFAGLAVDEITSETVPYDFPRRPPIHRAWLIAK